MGLGEVFFFQYPLASLVCVFFWLRQVEAISKSVDGTDVSK